MPLRIPQNECFADYRGGGEFVRYDLNIKTPFYPPHHFSEVRLVNGEEKGLMRFLARCERGYAKEKDLGVFGELRLSARRDINVDLSRWLDYLGYGGSVRRQVKPLVAIFKE